MITDLDNLHQGADGEKDEKFKPEVDSSEKKEDTIENSDDITPEKFEEVPVVETETESEENEEDNKTSEPDTSVEEVKQEQESISEVESNGAELDVISTDDDSEVNSFETETEEEEEEEEEETKDEIPFKNYDDLSITVLINEAKHLLKEHPVQKLKEHFNQIRDAVKNQLEEDEISKKDAYVADGGDPVDFQYDSQERKEFNAIYNEYRKQLDTYYKEQDQLQKVNLIDRVQIIDELKALYLEPNDDNSNIFTTFRKLKTRWHNAGPIPKAQAGNIFRTYFHHLDNFYEYLDLNKELRELDYAHNLQVRESIINRAEELVKEENVQKALNELQYLHRLWKEEAVPVAEELREPTWQKFKDLTQKIHERKSELGEKIKAEQEENLKKKQDILDEIEQLSVNAENKSHGEWQTGIKRLNQLRENFLAIGRVPREVNQQMWDKFKIATRDFNHKKNEFYKSLKSEQQINLEKKQELLKIAQEHSQSSDWNNSVQVIKRIQSDWKKIGHVPRKYSDAIWKEFKDACNLFFDRYKNRNSQNNKEFEDNLVQKEAFLEEVKNFKTTGDAQKDLDSINDFNLKWNSFGKVPASKMSINSDFNKTVGDLVKSLGLSQNEIQDFKMASLVDQIKSGQDGRLLDDEIRKTRKLIEELEKEINQLETNVGFFANANADSPLLRDVFKQIEEKRSRLVDAEIRLRKLHQIDFYDDDDQ